MDGSLVCRFTRSTVGMKVLMAITGLVMFGYLLGHVMGNMLIFAGRDKINQYSAFLHHSPGILWGTRILLLGSVGVHIWATARFLSLRRAARPVPYGLKISHGSTLAAQTMFWSGPVIAVFVLYHILHLTTGTMHPTFERNVSAVTHEVDVYQNLIDGFRMSAFASGFYIVGMLAIALHLSHGIWSMLQTVGVNRPNWEPALRCLALCVAILLCGAFIAVPVAVLAGWVNN